MRDADGLSGGCGGGGRGSSVELVMLHLVADLGGSAGVALSSWLVDGHGLHIADPAIAIVIAAIITYGYAPARAGGARAVSLSLACLSG